MINISSFIFNLTANKTGTLADMSDSDYAIGCSASTGLCESDLAINTNFFATFPEDVYVVELRAKNIQNAIGKWL